MVNVTFITAYMITSDSPMNSGAFSDETGFRPAL
jgi:hypothetical protein